MFAAGPTLALALQGEIDDINGAARARTRQLSKPGCQLARAHEGDGKMLPYMARNVRGSENGRNEVSANGGEQLLPPGGVWD